MSISSIGKDCVGCGACKNSCPQKCISMQVNNEGFLYPNLDANKCLECGICERVCPSKIKKENVSPIAYYAARSRDEVVRKESSSGGIFFEVAKAIFRREGIVWGAKFNELWEVIHDRAYTIDGIKPFMSSKYAQSKICHIFPEVKNELEDGKIVLFTGTPCQIVALKNFLHKEYDNLYTVDIACHGVPSPLVWQEYLNTISKGKKIDHINFREKTPGWESYSVKYIINGVTTRNLRVNDPYMCGYIDGLYTRPSCHQCLIKPNHYASDLSIGDFWGIDRLNPSMSDDRGTSLVAVRTKKGEELLKKANIEMKEYPYQQIEAYNQSFSHISSPSPLRERFWEDAEKYGIGPMVLKYGKRLRPSWDIRLKMWIYNILHK